MKAEDNTRKVNGKKTAGKKKNSRKRKKTNENRSYIMVIAVFVVIALILTIWGMIAGEQNKVRDILRRHPMKYTEEIRRYAAENNLEPAYVASVVLAESSYDPQAVSSVGAQGLMQIMPETGEWIAGKLKESYFDGCLFDPDTNLRYGCWYLGYLMNRYNQDKKCSSAAYHSGQGTVDKWLADPAYSSNGNTLDVIGGDNAAVYVERILKYYEVYVDLYEKNK